MQHHDKADCNINHSLKHPLLLHINHIVNRSILIIHKKTSMRMLDTLTTHRGGGE